LAITYGMSVPLIKINVIVRDGIDWIRKTGNLSYWLIGQPINNQKAGCHCGSRLFSFVSVPL
jgi:hypothetical protein